MRIKCGRIHPMAHKRTTSKKVAKKASGILRDPKSSKKEKSVAGSALSQSPGKHLSKGKKKGK